MSGTQSYHASVIVLRKRKLGESDLILSMLAGDGSLVEAVAKGARKPKSSFAARLDLFCECEVMLVRGRNLDIASEVRLISGHGAIRSNASAVYAASPILDCLARTALPNLPVPNLYPMASSALSHVEMASEGQMPLVTAAFLMKLFALLGVLPRLDACVSCGAQREQSAHAQVDFSYTEGGYVCQECNPGMDTVRVDNQVLSWASALLLSTFDEVCAFVENPDAAFAVLHFAHRWLRETQNINSKALNELLVCGLF